MNDSVTEVADASENVSWAKGKRIKKLCLFWIDVGTCPPNEAKSRMVKISTGLASVTSQLKDQGVAPIFLRASEGAGRVELLEVESSDVVTYGMANLNELSEPDGSY